MYHRIFISLSNSLTNQTVVSISKIKEMCKISSSTYYLLKKKNIIDLNNCKTLSHMHSNKNNFKKLKKKLNKRKKLNQYLSVAFFLSSTFTKLCIILENSDEPLPSSLPLDIAGNI